MPIIDTPNLEQASIYSDLNSLDHIRQLGHTDQLGAIKKAAKEFEAFFMNMMLKSMRQASEVIGSDSPMFSQQEKMYTSMLDEQLSVNLSQGGHLRIADMMVEQLTRQYGTSSSSLDTSFHLSKVQELANNVKEQVGSETITTNNLVDTNEEDKQLVDDFFTQLQPLITLNKKADSSSLLDPNSQKAVVEISSPVAKKQVGFEVAEENNTKPEKKPLFEKVSDFVNELMPHAINAAKKLNLDPRVLIAQAALETGWGKFIMHDSQGQPGFNLFGIKSNRDWQGGSIEIDTLEVEAQEFKKVNASFRKYESFAESFEDYVDFILSSPRYESAVKAAGNAERYLNELQGSGYATDPNYANKILRIFQEQQVQGVNGGLK